MNFVRCCLRCKYLKHDACYGWNYCDNDVTPAMVIANEIEGFFGCTQWEEKAQ